MGEGRGWGGKEYEGRTPVVCNFLSRPQKISQAFIIIMIISGFFNIKVFNVKYSWPVVDATKFLVAATLMNPFYELLIWIQINEKLGFLHNEPYRSFY